MFFANARRLNSILYLIMKAKNQPPKLKPKLELFDSSMMVIGIVIGSGIFMTTGLMAESIPSVSLILITWIFGGVQMLAGALTYAELGAAMPKAGGQYVYLREAYGPLPAFLFGWVAFMSFVYFFVWMWENRLIE